MNILLVISLLLGLVTAKPKKSLGELLTEAAVKSVCNGFKCDGKYEKCEVISGSPLCVKSCPDCSINLKPDPVCGTDGNTYKTRCSLEQAECMGNAFIDVSCEGKCPCDPEEVVKMDPSFVHKLQKLRKQVELEREFKSEMKLESPSEKAFKELKPSETKKPEYLDITTEEELEQAKTKKMKDWQKKKLEHLQKVEKVKKQSLEQQNTKTKLNPDTCTGLDLAELPGRLIDWFHVLKSNNFRKTTNGTKSLKELKFLDAKLRAMYVSLACKAEPQRPDNEVFCLEPVKWMFEYLDRNNDDILEHTELADIEEADSEKCMKKFFLDCDRNMNGTVEKTEFCRCLCVEPPCTKTFENIPTLLVSGVPRPLPGYFVPKCDEDGFFIAKQCSDNECFCVDRNGQEVPNTRSNEKEMDCADNTLQSEARSTRSEKPAKRVDDGLPEYLIP